MHSYFYQNNVLRKYFTIHSKPMKETVSVVIKFSQKSLEVSETYRIFATWKEKPSRATMCGTVASAWWWAIRPCRLVSFTRIQLVLRGQFFSSLGKFLKRFLPFFLFVSEIFLTFAFEHRHDVRERTAVGHIGKNKSIRYYFAYSQKRRKLFGNKNAQK